MALLWFASRWVWQQIMQRMLNPDEREREKEKESRERIKTQNQT